MSIISRIISTFFNNDYPDKVQIKFREWLVEERFIEEKEKGMKSVWDSLQNIRLDMSTFRSLQETERKLDFHKKGRFSVKKQAARLTRIAAILILPLLSVIFTYIYFQSKNFNSSVKLSECYASHGELKTVKLPDGSVAVINSGSLLIYPEEEMDGKRIVYLNGEAFFEVEYNRDLPFIVKTNGLEVEVLGTKFNVSAYPDMPKITTTLKEGKIRINFDSTVRESVTLSPNDEVIYNRETDEIIYGKIADRYIGAWREGHLLFNEAPITEILRSFEHRYGVNVYLNSNKYTKDKLTVKFIHGETIKESLLVLEKIIPNFSYRLEDNKLYIY